jgi:hypothetical protein
MNTITYLHLTNLLAFSLEFTGNVHFCFTVEYDQEGGDPIKMKIEQESLAGYLSAMEGGSIRFMALCTIRGTPLPTDKVVLHLLLNYV